MEAGLDCCLPPNCVFPFSGPWIPRALAVVAFELVGNSYERAGDDGAVVGTQVRDAGFDDDTAGVDDMTRVLTACPVRPENCSREGVLWNAGFNRHNGLESAKPA